MATQPQPAGTARQFTWQEIVFAAGSAILLIALALIFSRSLWSDPEGGTDTFRFIALMITFMAALAATAGVFIWLGMGNSEEAFGLPTGSMRALLAIGIMILLVVFGLPLVSPLPESANRLTTQPAQVAQVPAAALRETIELNRQQGFTVAVLSRGTATEPGRIAIYGKVRTRDAAELDLGKQVLTAIITLLTTVIGFYFGSRSAGEAVRDGPRGEPAGPVGGLPADRKRVAEAAAALKARIAGAGQQIDAIKADPATPANSWRTEALADLEPVRTAREAGLAAIDRHIAAADTALAARQTATAPADVAGHEKVVREELAAAEHGLTEATKAQDDYEKQVEALKKL